jgi:hypothetical protein
MELVQETAREVFHKVTISWCFALTTNIRVLQTSESLSGWLTRDWQDQVNGIHLVNLVSIGCMLLCVNSTVVGCLVNVFLVLVLTLLPGHYVWLQNGTPLGQLSLYSDGLQPGWPGFDSWQGKIVYLLQCPEQLWGPPSILSSEYCGLFPQGSGGQGVKLIIHIILCQGQEWWNYIFTPPYIFMVYCLIN